nr:hypothetical protein [Tanacetum cinerariifolium]
MVSSLEKVALSHVANVVKRSCKEPSFAGSRSTSGPSSASQPARASASASASQPLLVHVQVNLQGHLLVHMQVNLQGHLLVHLQVPSNPKELQVNLQVHPKQQGKQKQRMLLQVQRRPQQGRAKDKNLQRR